VSASIVRASGQLRELALGEANVEAGVLLEVALQLCKDVQALDEGRAHENVISKGECCLSVQSPGPDGWWRKSATFQEHRPAAVPL